ncbi:hypothetical protein O181_002676 [Austropuccinia psidii MF-1]|uniref:Wax synthase domain-containing protein n=1 Tax=Austropuccinia psidii MF-1 TaxID=1389203 RepID=A0A9Q3BCC6_9BASI|nr:hypothetical protein [Austropuccinia psidii MF-1]
MELDVFSNLHIHTHTLITFAEVMLGIFLGALTIPSKSVVAHAFRLALLAVTFPKIIDLATNKTHSIGIWLFDQTFFTMFSWHAISHILDIALVSFLPSSAPFWIRPTPKELERMDHLRQKPSKDIIPSQDQLFPKEWEVVPHPPPFSLDRALYAIDFLTLLRPGTSWLFPWQFRAFDWSLPAFKSPHRFGKPEGSYKVAVFHCFLFLSALLYFNLLNGADGPIMSFSPFNLLNQFLLTFSAGCMVCLISGPVEALSFGFLLRQKILPTSALLNNFNQPYLSLSIEDFWGRRWHHFVRRKLTRLGSLLPYGSTKSGNAFWAYVLSGIMHSFFMARVKPEPTLSQPLSYLSLWYDSGTFWFFSLQGVGMLVERAFIPGPWKRLWLWLSIIPSGHWYIDSILQKDWILR